SSFYALNRALLLKWVWRYKSQDGSLWCHIIRALYGDSIDSHGYRSSSCWSSILWEVRVLEDKGTFCVKDIRLLLDDLYLPSLGVETRWVKHVPIKVNVFAWRARLDRLPTRLNLSKRGSFSDWDAWLISIRLSSKLKSLLEGVFLTAWWSIWSFRNRMLFDDVPPRRTFCVKDIRLLLDDLYLPSLGVETRWVKHVPIKVNVFAWRARLDRLPTRLNLSKRGILTKSIACPICDSAHEDLGGPFGLFGIGCYSTMSL
nr:hypothetical protein [Tanacetum cinerariifolium]